MKIRVNIENSNSFDIKEIVNEKEAVKFARINYPNLVCSNCEDGVLYESSDNNNDFGCTNCKESSKKRKFEKESPFSLIKYTEY